ncbi:hypothetical protein JL720_10906 [Aureococcus anophagefferens]|nr:hypothetical protein JL720_10906 [Aureococcus anophagefferens]
MAARATVALLLLLRPARGLENKYNENPDCDPSALLGGAPPAPLAALARCTRSRDLALVGNSVTRHVYFSIANVLRSGEVGDVVAAGRADPRGPRVPRGGEAALQPARPRRLAKKTRPGDDRTPARRFNADHDPDALVRGACDEALPGDGHLFAYWNTTGQLPAGRETKIFNTTLICKYSHEFDTFFSLSEKNPPRENDPLPEDALGRLRAHAAQRGTRLTIVVFNTLMHALSEPRARDLDARRAVADSVAAVADAARGWAELAWLPAPRVCGPAPGWAIKHFGLPDYGGDELNAPRATTPSWRGASRASRPPCSASAPSPRWTPRAPTAPRPARATTTTSTTTASPST